MKLRILTMGLAMVILLSACSGTQETISTDESDTKSAISEVQSSDDAPDHDNNCVELDSLTEEEAKEYLHIDTWDDGVVCDFNELSQQYDGLQFEVHELRQVLPSELAANGYSLPASWTKDGMSLENGVPQDDAVIILAKVSVTNTNEYEISYFANTIRLFGVYKEPQMVYNGDVDFEQTCINLEPFYWSMPAEGSAEKGLYFEFKLSSQEKAVFDLGYIMSKEEAESVPLYLKVEDVAIDVDNIVHSTTRFLRAQ